MREGKTEFLNRTPMIQGACRIISGEEKGVPVAPGETVWLTEEEQEVTAAAPRQSKDNPFIAGSAPDGGVVLEAVTTGRPIGSRPIPGHVERQEAEVAPVVHHHPPDAPPGPPAAADAPPGPLPSTGGLESSDSDRGGQELAAAGEFAATEETGVPTDSHGIQEQ